MSITLRLLRRGDLAFCDELRRAANWNQVPEDWERFLRLSPDGCFLGEMDGRPAGTVTTIHYQRKIGWIGMLLVHPEKRGRGVGSALLKHAVEYLQEQPVRTIKLDATPAGEPLYAREGFHVEFHITRWERNDGSKPLPDIAPVDPFQETDLSQAVLLDQNAFGTPRTELLAALRRDALLACVFREGNAIEGFGMLRRGSRAKYLGPVVATSAVVAKSLVYSLIAQSGDRPLFWDLPDTQLPRISPESLGFTMQRKLTRMSIGPRVQPAGPETYWALADPACG